MIYNLGKLVYKFFTFGEPKRALPPEFFKKPEPVVINVPSESDYDAFPEKIIFRNQDEQDFWKDVVLQMASKCRYERWKKADKVKRGPRIHYHVEEIADSFLWEYRERMAKEMEKEIL